MTTLTRAQLGALREQLAVEHRRAGGIGGGANSELRPDAGGSVQHVALSTKRRTVGRVPAGIARPRQAPILTTAWCSSFYAATAQQVAVGAPFRRSDHPCSVQAGDEITNVVHAHSYTRRQ
jgi:hypothetical protein